MLKCNVPGLLLADGGGQDFNTRQRQRGQTVYSLILAVHVQMGRELVGYQTKEIIFLSFHEFIYKIKIIFSAFLLLG
jgi:hypothetical protein